MYLLLRKTYSILNIKIFMQKYILKFFKLQKLLQNYYKNILHIYVRLIHIIFLKISVIKLSYYR